MNISSSQLLQLQNYHRNITGLQLLQPHNTVSQKNALLATTITSLVIKCDDMYTLVTENNVVSQGITATLDVI